MKKDMRTILLNTFRGRSIIDYIEDLEERNKLLEKDVDHLNFMYKQLADRYGRLKEKYVQRYR